MHVDKLSVAQQNVPDLCTFQVLDRQLRKKFYDELFGERFHYKDLNAVNPSEMNTIEFIQRQITNRSYKLKEVTLPSLGLP